MVVLTIPVNVVDNMEWSWRHAMEAESNHAVNKQCPPSRHSCSHNVRNAIAYASFPTTGRGFRKISLVLCFFGGGGHQNVQGSKNKPKLQKPSVTRCLGNLVSSPSVPPALVLTPSTLTLIDRYPFDRKYPHEMQLLRFLTRPNELTCHALKRALLRVKAPAS